VLLALPCSLDGALVPGPCTFPGWEAEADRVGEIVRSAFPEAGPEGPRAIPWRVLNDAELAGFAALEEMNRLDWGGKALVLTLGFGPGGALVNRASS
jgi:hypothetical protein